MPWDIIFIEKEEIHLLTLFCPRFAGLEEAETNKQEYVFSSSTLVVYNLRV